MIEKAAMTARYADGEGEELKAQIAKIEGVAPDQVFLANGSAPICVPRPMSTCSIFLCSTSAANAPAT